MRRNRAENRYAIETAMSYNARVDSKKPAGSPGKAGGLMNHKEFRIMVAQTTLAAPVYAVGEFGKTRLLPAGTAVEMVRFSAPKSCPDAVTVLAVDPDLDYPDPGTELWYVTASALRFEGVGS